MLEKTLESPLDCKEIQPVHPKGSQSWLFIGRTDAEAETPILWPPYVKSWLSGKDPDAGKDWGQEEKGTTEDEMAGWHHRLDGHEFEWTPGVGDGKGGLACCNSWGYQESDTTEWLNWTELNEKRTYRQVIKRMKEQVWASKLLYKEDWNKNVYPRCPHHDPEGNSEGRWRKKMLRASLPKHRILVTVYLWDARHVLGLLL